MDKRVSIATITNTAAVSEAAKKKKKFVFYLVDWPATWECEPQRKDFL